MQSKDEAKIAQSSETTDVCTDGNTESEDEDSDEAWEEETQKISDIDDPVYIHYDIISSDTVTDPTETSDPEWEAVSESESEN
jgi:hypothetical protein